MKPEAYRKDWDCLRETTPSPDRLRHLARQVALSFLDHYLYSDRYESEYIRILCEMTTAFDDDELNGCAASALFGIVIESLCDDFEELQTQTYNRVICQVVSFLRELPDGTDLDAELRAFGLDSEESLFRRIERLRERSDTFAHTLENPRKVLILSRVTIGADVAVSSVIVQRLVTAFPGVEIVLIGTGALTRLFGGNPAVRVRQVSYPRRGGLLARFASWHAVLEAINDEMTGGPAGTTAIIDPDSRLSQLGVLPLTDERNYFFFNTRAWAAYPPKISISAMANHWLDSLLGQEGYAHPSVWVDPDVARAAEDLASGLRTAGANRLVALNFGVGGNSRKRVSTTFEKGLILELLEAPGTVLLLDKGAGDEEVERAEALMRAAEEAGHTVADGTFENIGELRLSTGVIGVQSKLDEVAALISQCDEFIGYDSACQHIAAALGVPTYTVFAGTNNPRFVRRWRACGPATSEVIHVDTITHPRLFDDEDVVARLIDAKPQPDAPG